MSPKLSTLARGTAFVGLIGWLCAGAARADDPNALPLPPPLVQAPVAAPEVPSAGDHWGVVSATTDSPGHDVLSFEAGFPGVSFGYTHGMSDTTDWGVKVDVLYGVLYTPNTQFGMAARLPLRMVLARANKLTLLVHIDPGLFTYASGSDGPSLFGVLLPVGAALGFEPVSNLRVSFGVDLPMAIQFLHGADFLAGPQFGFTAEVFVNRQVSVGVNMRFGPMFETGYPDNPQLGFVTQATLGYRL